MKDCVLYTAGVDSYILREFLIRTGHDVDCLYFNHGGRYTMNEMKKIKQLMFPVTINETINMRNLEQPDAFIPNRNSTFCIAANSLGYDKIWIGGSLSDRVCDNNEKVFEQLSEFLTNMHGRYIKIDSPFWHIYKDDMVRWYNSVSNITDLVYNTFSCFNPVSEHSEYFEYGNSKGVEYKTEECLNCSACFRKCAVLYNAGIYIDFKNPKIVKKYFEDFMRPLAKTARSNGTMDYIKCWLSRGNKCE